MILHNHRRLPVSIFSVKIAALGSLKVFEAGYWKDFQNQETISKEQAKTLSFIFHQLGNKKL
jgi:hypothetical protein